MWVFVPDFLSVLLIKKDLVTIRVGETFKMVMMLLGMVSYVNFRCVILRLVLRPMNLLPPFRSPLGLMGIAPKVRSYMVFKG